MPELRVWSENDNRYITKYINVDPRNITVFLEKYTDPTSIFCMHCGNKLFDAQYRITNIVPGSAPVEINYIKLLCKHPNCKTFYWFVGVT